MIDQTDTFVEYWDEVISYCESVNITTSYYEEEFLIDGEDNRPSVDFIDPITGEVL